MVIQKLKLYQETPKGNIKITSEKYEDYIAYQEGVSIVGYLNQINYVKNSDAIIDLEVNFETGKGLLLERWYFISENESFTIKIRNFQFFCNWHSLDTEGECTLIIESENTYIDRLDLEIVCNGRIIRLKNIENCKISSDIIGYLGIGGGIRNVIISGDQVNRLSFNGVEKIDNLEINLTKEINSIWMAYLRKLITLS